MPDRSAPHQTLDQVTADALALHRALRPGLIDSAHVLTARVTDAQALASTALQLFLDLERDAPRAPSVSPLLLDRVAHIAKAAQDVGAELTAALARTAENQRRRHEALPKPAILIGPSPRQFIESAIDLLDGLLALCHAIRRDRLLPPHPPAQQPH
ncbi:hypothetical protein [Streptomyces sp. SYSU K217416]